MPKRGEIWWVSFDPSIGTEIQKTRPAIVISNDIANEKGSRITVLPITSRIKHLPIVVILEADDKNGLNNQSLIRVPDVCTFDKSRFKSKIGTISEEKMNEVEEKLRIHLAL